LKDKLAPITIMDTKTIRITDFVITSPLSHHLISGKVLLTGTFIPIKTFFTFILPLFIFDYISFTPKRKYGSWAAKSGACGSTGSHHDLKKLHVIHLLHRSAPGENLNSGKRNGTENMEENW
jgi:hypothetical protein